MWSRWERHLLLVGIVCLFEMVPAEVCAQATRNLDLGTFRPTAGTEADFITVQSPQIGAHRAWLVGVGFNYAVNPLVVESEEASMSDVPVASRMATDLFGAYAFLDRYEVSLRIPLLVQRGEEPEFSSIRPADGFALGDLVAAGKVGVLRSRPLSLAMAVHITLPTASDEEFAGGDGFGAGASAIAGVELGRFRLGANLGYVLRPQGLLADVVQGDEISYGGALSYLAHDELQIISEFYGAFGLEGDETGGISPLEGALGVRYHWRPAIGIVAGLGRGLLSGIGAPDLRGFLLVSIAPGRGGRDVATVTNAALANPTGDIDGDGIINRDDKCPEQAEDEDGFEDEDGCGDFDNDGDKLVDSVDKCPMIAEDRDGYLDEDGCPDEDNDGDDIPDSEDRCPNEPEDKDGFADDDGCDDFDNDRDGVPDLMDACPTKAETINGRADEDGCPDKGDSAVIVLADQISLLQPVRFVGKTARIAARSNDVLGQLAATLRARVDLKNVSIEGHVHRRGSGDMKLSQARAEAVRGRLAEAGVAVERLQAVGLGSAHPIRREGKRQQRFNDRIVIKILPVKQ